MADGARTNFSGGHDTWVQAIGFSKDGSQIFSGGCDGKLTWWDAASKSPSQAVPSTRTKAGFARLDVSPDGTLIATGGNDNQVKLWKRRRRKTGSRVTKPCPPRLQCRLPPQGKLLLSGDLMGVVNQWDVATGKLMRTFDAKALHTYEGGQQVDYGGVRSIAISPDGKWLAAGGLYKGTNPLGAVNEPLVLLFNWETQKA